MPAMLGCRFALRRSTVLVSRPVEKRTEYMGMDRQNFAEISTTARSTLRYVEFCKMSVDLMSVFDTQGLCRICGAA